MSFDARQAQKIAGAIQYLADNSKPPDKVWNDKQSVSAFLIGNIGDLKGDGEDAKQKLSIVDNDPCKISLSVSTTDGKGRTTDQIFEFTLSDMDKGLTDIKVSGKKVEVTISCKNRQKLVKVYKNGEQQAWGTSVSIGADDVEKARNIAEAFRNAITQCEK